MGRRERPALGVVTGWRRKLLPVVERLLLPDLIRLDPTIRHAALTTALFGISMAIWCLVFIPIHVLLGSNRCAVILVVAGVAFVGNAAALHVHASLSLTRNVIAAVALVTLLHLSVYSGGYDSAAMIWLPSVPMIAVLLSGWRTGLAWLLLTAGSVWTMFFLDRAGGLPPSDFTAESTRLLFVLALVGIVFCIALLSMLFETIADALRRRLVAARESADEANRAKSAFLARMSHEIRTPMHGVLGMLELLGDTQATGRQREYTGFARQSAESLLRILNDILDFSKIEAGRLELESIPFKLRDVVGDTLQALAVNAEAKGLELVCHVSPEVPNDLEGDPGRLRQILVNLVGNAIKFTEKGEVALSIAPSSVSVDGPCLAFCVRDSGVGIPAEKRAKIWDVFGQADVSTTRRFGGTGLGLNISREIVRMMGGDLTFESEEGKGTTFSFTLAFGMPVLEGPRRDSTDAAMEGVTREVPSPAGAGSAMRPLRILLAEDGPLNRMVAVGLLEAQGHGVTVAEDGRQAVAAWQEGTFDLILMDLEMPEMDGLEATRLIRERERGGETHVPIVALTAHAIPEYEERCMAAGMDAHLAKPFEPERLYAALRELT